MATKTGQVAVGDPRSLETGRQGLPPEVGKATRAREAANIRQQLNIVLGEQRQEVLQAAGRVAEGEDGGGYYPSR